MKIEKQVCTLEQAKKLNDLGVAQSSLFYWKENEIQIVVTEKQMKEWIEKYLPTLNEYYSAFTLSELSAMIKGGSYEAERLWNRMLSRINGGNSCTLFYQPSFLADFLIDILEAKYLSVEACNKRVLA